MQYRDQLEINFESASSQSEKRQRKAEIFQSLKQQYAQLKQERWNGYTGYDPWFNEPLSNANFALVATYHDLVPAFRQLLATKPDLPAFYQSVRTLARLDKKTRREYLQKYISSPEDLRQDQIPFSAAAQ